MDEADRLKNRRMLAYASDIPLEIARAAHSGTSLVPDERARQEQQGYAATLANDHANLEKLATTDEKRSLLTIEFSRYRLGYLEHTKARLRALSRCLSSMVTGPSNFPTRRNAKANDSAEKRTTELIEFRNRALESIRRQLQPELAPIMAGDDDALPRLEAKIAEAERAQEKMVATNAAIRKHAKAGPDAQIAALVQLGHSERIARALLAGDELRRVGYADYQLKNNSRNIRRMRERLESLRKTKGEPDAEIEGQHAKLVDCPAENRVRLFYPGKPESAVISGLKSAGFRWTPSLGCWQAFRNPRSLDAARRKAGIPASLEASQEGSQVSADPA